MTSESQLWQVKDFRDRNHDLNGITVDVEGGKSHLGLPSVVDLPNGHPLSRQREVIALHVSDEGPTVGKKERIVAPSALAQSLAHFWPHVGVTSPIFLHSIWTDRED